MQDVGYNPGRSFSNIVKAFAGDVPQSISLRVASKSREIEGGNRPVVHFLSSHFSSNCWLAHAKRQSAIGQTNSTQMLRAHTPCLH
jgi:hypothetical protein